MKVIAPGKLILSGEHAVVYGHPALAMAVNRYVTASISDQDVSLVSLDFADLAYECSLSFAALAELKARISYKYKQFINGKFNIREVLQKPFELAQFALGLCFDMLHIPLKQGMKIDVRSTIPIGCGMGSSAATILSIMQAVASHAGLQVPAQRIYELGLQAENMQHGVSSGLDLYISLNGGCCYVKEKVITPRAMPMCALYLVNTGSPETTTGECVTAVADMFKQTTIGNDFAAVTDSMDHALQYGQLANVRDAIRANHQLLQTIGVVPEKISSFIAEIEQLGGAAKICGAGAVAGDNAGIVMVLTDDIVSLTSLIQKYAYTLLPMSGETRGVHVTV